MTFAQWYKVSSEDLDKFNALPFEFKLGILIRYAYAIGYVIIVSDLGYKVRLKTEEPPNYLFTHEDKFDLKDHILFYKEAFKRIFELEQSKLKPF